MKIHQHLFLRYHIFDMYWVNCTRVVLEKMATLNYLGNESETELFWGTSKASISLPFQGSVVKTGCYWLAEIETSFKTSMHLRLVVKLLKLEPKRD